MTFGPYLLPSARRAHKELDRYVRSEYRDVSSGWFAANCGDKTCLRLPGEERPAGPIDTSVPEICASTAPRHTNCPVLNAIVESRLMKELAPRGELSGRE
jgi:hypothetical protein